MTHYRRTIITGNLTTKSNLHIGSGEERSGSNEKESDKPEGLVNEIVRNGAGKAYIPASSLRGFLRNKITDPVLRQALFGLARQPTPTQRATETEKPEERGSMGHLRLYDAPIHSTTNGTDQISRTRIDPLTQAAKEHHLFTHDLIPPGSVFNLTLELDNSTEEEINTLLQALATLDNTPGNQLGKGKSIGQGRLVWKLTKILGLTETSLKCWLQPSATVKPKQNKRKRGKPTEGNKTFSSDPLFIPNYFEDLTQAFNEALKKVKSPITSLWSSIAFTLKPHAPLLINDPQRVKQLEKEQEAERKRQGEEALEKEKITPDLIYMCRQGQACIPGSTLKGWLRAHCRRILLTLQQGRGEEQIEQMLAQLFGSTEQGQGLLQFEDALAKIDPQQHSHRQTFIAIDRFTGGAKSSALYNVEAIWPDAFSGCIHYRKGRLLEGWMKMLLLYALRDAMEGDLVLGWGKSRGYGRLTLKTTGIDLSKYATEQLGSWQQELQIQLKQEIAV